MAETKQKNKRTKEQVEASISQSEASKCCALNNEEIQKPTLEPLTNDYIVQVASAVHGELIFKSKNTGYKVKWNEFGETNSFTIRDLFDMRNGSRDFFTRNWITIEDPRADEVYKILGVDKFYGHIRSVKDVDTLILNTPTEEMKDVISELPSNSKEVVAKRAYELKKSNILDSAKKIDVIEASTHIKFED